MLTPADVDDLCVQLVFIPVDGIVVVDLECVTDLVEVVVGAGVTEQVVADLSVDSHDCSVGERCQL